LRQFIYGGDLNPRLSVPAFLVDIATLGSNDPEGSPVIGVQLNQDVG
jgi:hypothetical protein